MTGTTADARSFFADLARFRFDRLDLPLGVGGAILIVGPLLVSNALHLGSPAVIATFGLLNLFLVILPRPQRSRAKIAALAVGTNALGFGVGSLIVLLPDPLEVAVVAIATTVALVAGRDPRWENLGTFSVILMVVGVGIPSAGLPGVPFRMFYVLVGGAIAWAGWMVLVRWLPPLVTRDPPPAPPDLTTRVPVRSELPYAAVTGITAAVGLAIGLGLGLERDYWVMLTVVVALRMQLSATITTSTARVLGTVIGAGLGSVLTLVVTDPWVLATVLGISAALTLATRTVNGTFYVVWVTLFIVGLLNLLYSGGPAYAYIRVLDTLIGGALALTAALVVTQVVPAVRSRLAPRRLAPRT
ncbi:MAG TPA: FUSC family protein [Thermoplasmata archaeon]|nr:FUSC family protein [Thermoplasmata archaeon]